MRTATCSKQEMLSVFENKREGQCGWYSVSREDLRLGCVGINTTETGMPTNGFDLVILLSEKQDTQLFLVGLVHDNPQVVPKKPKKLS